MVFDPQTSSAWSAMAERLEAAGCQLVGVESNLVDHVWSADPLSPQPARWGTTCVSIIIKDSLPLGLKNPYSPSRLSLPGELGRIRWKRFVVCSRKKAVKR